MALINPNSKRFKNGMAKLYGWGASIVILGALFKLQHWTGAGAMLTIGLTIEAIIFFFSALYTLFHKSGDLAPLEGLCPIITENLSKKF